MNLRQIIRESIDSVILDSIINEAIEEATGSAGQAQPGSGGQTATPNQQQASIFKQYADELRKLFGNNGIDPKPVQNNQAAAQHIVKLNRFVYAVINAIDSENIDSVNSPAAGNGYTRYNNPYGKDKTDMARDAMRGSVNYLGGQAENLLGNGAGLQNNPLNGVFRAGVDAYNNTNNLFTQQFNNRKYEELYNNPSRNGNAGGSLTYLMQSVNDGCYPRLQTEYNQINQQNNNIFSATPDVGNCYQVLQALSVAVTSYANSQKQQNTQQPNGGQPNGGQPNGGQPNGGQPNGGNSQPVGQPNGNAGNGGQPNGNAGNGGQPNGNAGNNQPGGDFNPKPSGKKINFKPTDNPTYRPNYSKYVNELNGKGDKIADIVEGIENKASDSNVVNILQWIGNLSDDVVSAIQNGSYYKEDYQNTRIKPLTKLMSLDGSKTGEEGTYEWVFWTYQKLHRIYERMPESNEFKALNEKDVVYTMQSLRFLYTQMKRDNIVDKPQKNNR